MCAKKNELDFIDQINLPERYEKFVRRYCGNDWKTLIIEMDGGLGVAICKAILDGQPIDLASIAKHLGINPDLLAPAYERLSRNGYMKAGRLQSDRDLMSGDKTAWGYIAGMASNLTGVGSY